jgi:chitin disaccharide deacetylase
MLIINADDFGRNSLATDRILTCFDRGALTSTSAMVFMEDSERAAQLARKSPIDIGLHLNFSEKFSDPRCDQVVRAAHERIIRFLRKGRMTFLVYNPLLHNQFKSAFQSQFDEFVRLFGRCPSHFDGHHHMHLCSNSLLGGLIPVGEGVRRNFSFRRGEKGRLNRMYRSVSDWWLLRKHQSTDYLFSLPECLRFRRCDRVFDLAKTSNVELEVHPELDEDFEVLMSNAFLESVSSLKTGTYRDL